MMSRKPERIKRVLLINPFFYERKSMNIGVDPVVPRQAGHEIKTGLTFPIGLAYMGATLLQNGHKVQVLDPIAQKIPLSQIHRAAGWSDAIFMPFSAPHEKDIKRFRDIFKNKYFILGGIYAKFIPEILLSEDYCDAIFDIESELIVVDFVNKYPDIENVSGIKYKKNGEIVTTSPRPLIQNIDELPFPARELVNPRIYWDICFFGQPTAWILPSRGCPFNCIFCTKISNSLRFRSIKNVVDEIESVICNFGIKNFVFFDGNFNQNNEFAKSVCKEILRRKIKIQWSCSGRADFVNEDIAILMKKAGCIEMTVGLESANDDILKYLQKGTTIEKIRRGLQILKKVGLTYSIHCIFGSPMENSESIDSTMKFIKEFKPLFVSYNILTPLPGSKLFEEFKNKISLEQAKRFDFLHTDYPIGQYSGKRLNSILRKAYISYYVSFTYLMRILTEMFKRPRLIFGMLKILLTHSFYIYNSIMRKKT